MNREAGAVSVLLLVVVALAGLLCLAVADAGAVLVAHVRGRSAADAAALAAAAAQWPFVDAPEGPGEAAQQLADANGVELVSCDCPLRGERATVRIRVRPPIRMLTVAPRAIVVEASASLMPRVLFLPP